MNSLNRTLTGLAVAAAAAALVYTLRAPGDTASPAPPAAPVQALPLALPPAASASADSTPAVAAPGRAAMPPAPVASPRIGSEGYGPHIERAQAGDDAQAAWQAVQWLRQCISNEGLRTSFETLRAQGVSPEMMTQLMVEADAEARRCQTVTDLHRALLPQLAARAMRAGVPEAASAYAQATFAAELTAAQRQEVADAMRRDAQAGHAPSLLGALVAHDAWGLSDAEKLVYLAAYVGMPGPAGAGNQVMARSLMEQGTIRFKARPTAEQLAVATPGALQILERSRAASQP